ncbi:N-acetyltransferase [Thalassotalea insulae]|uniref:N-acetyltransferase n=1 Tax=Thalassotalea insulae TaxID=2056778 RepID=A0ABQ6GQT5_9GAMM|nr:GNAT family N-acetyltransferase [Thalassotalea insulae]GLX78323.1 N-acetyltransferase [Thalassotalea insulae]
MSAQLSTTFLAPEAEEFIAFRATIGWSNPDIQTVQHSIKHSLFWVCIRDQSQHLIATARVIGDNAMYYYIQDVIVHPEHQGQGLGNRLMEHIENYLAHQCQPGATIGLLAAQGKEAFYQKFGYSLRNGQPLGLALCKFV